jgi:hypothetical protein
MKVTLTQAVGLGSSKINFLAGHDYVSKITSGAGLFVIGGGVICHRFLELIVLHKSAGHDYVSANG